MKRSFFRVALFLILSVVTQPVQGVIDKEVSRIIKKLGDLNIDVSISYEDNELVIKKLSKLLDAYSRICAEKNHDYQLYKYLVSPLSDAHSRTCSLSSVANAVVQLNQNIVAVGLINKTIEILNIVTAERLMTLRGHDDRVSALCVLKTGHLISGAEDGSLVIWTPETYKIGRRFNAHKAAITSIIELGEQTIVTASADKTIKILDMANGIGRELDDHSLGVNSVVKIDQERLASGSSDCTVKIWNLNHSRCKNLYGHTDWVTKVFLLDDQTLASISDDGYIRIWDLPSASCKQRMTGHKGLMLSACKLDNGLLATVSLDRTAMIWNPQNGVSLQRIIGCDSEGLTREAPMSSILQLCDGNLLVTSDDKMLTVFDIYPEVIRKNFEPENLLNNRATIALILGLEKIFKAKGRVLIDKSWADILTQLPRAYKKMYSSIVIGTVFNERDCVVM